MSIARLIDAIVPKATEFYASVAVDLDLEAAGGMAKPAMNVWVGTTTGNVALYDVRGWKQIPVAVGYDHRVYGPWKYMGLGTQATVTSSGADTTPTLAPGATVTLRFDEGMVFGTGDVVITFVGTEDTMVKVAAAINAALQAAFPAPAHTYVTIAGNEYVLTGMGHGTTAAVEVVGFSAAGVGTTLGLTVATTNGTTSGAAVGIGVQW